MLGSIKGLGLASHGTLIFTDNRFYRTLVLDIAIFLISVVYILRGRGQNYLLIFQLYIRRKRYVEREEKREETACTLSIGTLF